MGIAPRGRQEWWQGSGSRSSLEDALEHVRVGRTARGQVDACRALFDALNRFYRAYTAAAPGPPIQSQGNPISRRSGRTQREGEAARLGRLMQDGIPAARQSWLLARPTLHRLAAFTPRIYSERTVWDAIEDGRYPGMQSEIPQEVLTAATADYTRFSEDMSEWRAGHLTAAATLKALGDVLYVVRSNIAHGEKTPSYGPDQSKVRRDRAVGAVVRPVLDDILEAILDFPCRRLATYGTLAPGEPNHVILAEMDQRWFEGTIDGIAQEEDGYRVVYWRWDGTRQRVSVRLLVSRDLYREWERLDQYAGSSYQRILVPVDLASGMMIVANLYEGVDDDR